MKAIVFLALIASLVVVQRRGVQEAFLKVWIPVFLTIPFAFSIDVMMIRGQSFIRVAVLPILVVLIRDQGHRMRMGHMEMLIALYVAVRVVADYTSRGYADAQNYAIYMILVLIAPYLFGRYVINGRRMDIATARMFVLMFVFFFPFFLYEAKFWVSPFFKVLSPFFPDAFSGLSIRWGLARTAGTFEHPILACIMIIIAYRLNVWLRWLNYWDGEQTGFMAWFERRTRWMRLPLKHRISVLLILMALMTISRGPWIGGFVGALIAGVGLAEKRGKRLVLVLSVLLVAGTAGKIGLDAYITPAVGEQLSGEAQTMLYRKVMVEKYQEFLFQHPYAGWGLTTVPKIRGMESIDNAFFLMALQHGVPAVAVFGLIFAYAIVTQIRFGLAAPPGEPPLGFTFSGIYLMCAIAFATVYMGSQTEPMLFLLLGWGEGIKQRGHSAPALQGQQAVRAGPALPFRRIIH
ncbi:MAG: hypothetical protein RIQ60_2026 [Pseudomonadota bacterium]|jgi:hypothetical protein